MATKQLRGKYARSVFLYGVASAFDLGFDRASMAQVRLQKLQDYPISSPRDDLKALRKDRHRVRTDTNAVLRHFKLS